MADFAKMDIFFVVATLAVVCIAILILIALFYVIRILRSAEKVAHLISEEGAKVRDDISTLRIQLQHGFKLRAISDFLGTLLQRFFNYKSKK